MYSGSALASIESNRAPDQCGSACLPTVAEAAEARNLRGESAVRAEPVAASWDAWVEPSKLCKDARRCVWSWASGWTSGQQCMLRLELCESVSRLLERSSMAPGAKDNQDATLGDEASLWVAGCIKLGACTRLKAIREDLEKKSPTQMLVDAWEAVERQCGAPVDSLDTNQVNLCLRLLSRECELDSKSPGHFLKVQIWRELIRIAAGAEDDDELWGSRTRSRHAADAEADDGVVLDWIRRSEHEVRETAHSLSAEQLAHEADRLLNFAAQMLLMGTRLKQAVEGWQRFDAYRILGILRNASPGEVRRAFYKKALVLHPDKGGDKAAFQELQRAYDEILAERRMQHSTVEEDNQEGCAENESQRPCPAQSPSRKSKAETQTLHIMEAFLSSDHDQSGGQWPVENSVVTPEEQEELVALATNLSSAAAGAGGRAVETLRLCWLGVDALEAEPLDLIEACSNTDAAIEEAKGVLDIGEFVEQYTREVSDLIVKISERESNINKGPHLPEDSDHIIPSFTEVIQGMSEAIEAINATSQSCSSVISSTIVTLHRLHELAHMLCGSASIKIVLPKGGGCGDCLINSLRVAISSLVEASQAVANACLDAVAASKNGASAIQMLKQNIDKTIAGVEEGDASPTQEETDVPADGNDVTGGDANTGGDAGLESEKIDQETNSEEEEEEPHVDSPKYREFEAQRSLTSLLEAVRMLRVTNRELLRVQSVARELQSKDADALPSMSGEMRQRAFALLAEFLDEAAVRFGESLHASLEAASRDATVLDESWVSSAAETCFGFLLRCSPDLAVSLNFRAQTLRAALAVDADRVQQMLEVEVAPRLRRSLMAVLLSAQVILGEDDSQKIDMLGVRANETLESILAMFSEIATRIRV